MNNNVRIVKTIAAGAIQAERKKNDRILLFGLGGLIVLGFAAGIIIKDYYQKRKNEIGQKNFQVKQQQSEIERLTLDNQVKGESLKQLENAFPFIDINNEVVDTRRHN